MSDYAIDIDKNYVSPYDKFFAEFDATHKKTPSQLCEIKKHQRIAELRDNPENKISASELWENF